MDPNTVFILLLAGIAFLAYFHLYQGWEMKRLINLKISQVVREALSEANSVAELRTARAVELAAAKASVDALAKVRKEFEEVMGKTRRATEYFQRSTEIIEKHQTQIEAASLNAVQQFRLAEQLLSRAPAVTDAASKEAVLRGIMMQVANERINKRVGYKYRNTKLTQLERDYYDDIWG